VFVSGSGRATGQPPVASPEMQSQDRRSFERRFEECGGPDTARSGRVGGLPVAGRAFLQSAIAGWSLRFVQRSVDPRARGRDPVTPEPGRASRRSSRRGSGARSWRAEGRRARRRWGGLIFALDTDYGHVNRADAVDERGVGRGGHRSGAWAGCRSRGFLHRRRAFATRGKRPREWTGGVSAGGADGLGCPAQPLKRFDTLMRTENHSRGRMAMYRIENIERRPIVPSSVLFSARPPMTSLTPCRSEKAVHS
jgi:hypothetical protein